MCLFAQRMCIMQMRQDTLERCRRDGPALWVAGNGANRGAGWVLGALTGRVGHLTINAHVRTWEARHDCLVQVRYYGAVIALGGLALVLRNLYRRQRPARVMVADKADSFSPLHDVYILL